MICSLIVLRSSSTQQPCWRRECQKARQVVPESINGSSKTAWRADRPRRRRPRRYDQGPEASQQASSTFPPFCRSRTVLCAAGAGSPSAHDDGLLCADAGEGGAAARRSAEEMQARRDAGRPSSGLPGHRAVLWKGRQPVRPPAANGSGRVGLCPVRQRSECTVSVRK